MEAGDIRIKQAIVHILDSTLAMPVLSDTVLDYGSDLADFLKGHICRIFMSDDVKKCTFQEEESEIYQMLKDYKNDFSSDEEDSQVVLAEEQKEGQEQFITLSKQIAEHLFVIMNQNIAIPQADLFILSISAYEEEFLVLLKMNYSSSYTHKTSSDPWGNTNEIIQQRAVLPSEKQRLSEAAIISMNPENELADIRILEKKYEINGVKTNYFSELFLKCYAALSSKSRLAIVTRAVEQVQDKYYDESNQFEVRMETKSILNAQFEEEGSLQVQDLAEKVFKENEEMKQEFREKMEKYHLQESEVHPKNQTTTKKFEQQYLTTDTGIEIKIPMEQYNNGNAIEFITNEDGTISVLIKNIGYIKSK